MMKKRKKTTRQEQRRKKQIHRDHIFGGVILGFLLMVLLLSLGLAGIIKAIASIGSDKKDQPPMQQTDALAEETLPEETTEPETEAIEPSSMTLLAVGDNLIHYTLNDYAQQEDGSFDYAPLYRYVKEEIQGADLACIQQETIFISDPSEYTNYPLFGTPTDMADSLAEAGFDVICESSNHTWDKHQQGIDDTLAKWKEYPEMAVLGIHESAQEAEEITVVERNGIRLALFDYAYGLNSGGPEEDRAYEIDLLDTTEMSVIKERLLRAKECSDMIVVFLHWGEEGSFSVNEEQEEWAQFFADNGVGLIIGTHPHVVQPVKEITGEGGNKTVVFYSLGNFVSHQMENYNMLEAMANVTITRDQSGTYVSEYKVKPLVNVIRKTGQGRYAICVRYLEDYTQDMAYEHVVKKCSPDTLAEMWQEVYGDV